MTSDFIDDLARACQKEGCPYILIVQEPSGRAVEVKSHLDNWDTCDEGKTIREDIHQLLDVTAFNDQ